MIELELLWQQISEAAAETDSCRSVHLVGGPVRDRLLGRPLVDLIDLDLVVEGDAQALAGLLRWQHGGDLTLHERFHTATWRPPGGTLAIDLVTARKESYPHPGALPVIEWGDLGDDLARRDFTINAMAMTLWPEPRWSLVDPVGGAQDLEGGLLRVLHERSFVDDPTRLLRLARFAVRLGFRPDMHTADLMHAAALPGPDGATALSTVSGDRMRHEWELICAEPDPPAVVRWLVQSTVAHALGLGAAGDKGLQTLQRGWEAAARDERPWNPRLALSLLLTGADPGPACTALGLVGRPAARVEGLTSIGQRLGGPVEQASGVWSLERMLHDSDVEERTVLEASYPAAAHAIRRYEDEVAGRPPLITGADLIAAGMRPGPEVGEALRAVRDAQLRGAVVTPSEAFALLDLPDPAGP